MNQGTVYNAPGLADQIRKAVQSGDLNLPPLPELATRIMDLLRDDETVGAAQLAELIGTDPALTASVLRLANSALFGGLRQVSDLDQAIVRLGLQQVGVIVTTVATQGHYTTKNPERLQMVRLLWNHAVTTALASRRLAAFANHDRTEAFLAGLLHDTGKLLVLRGLDDVERQASGLPLTKAVIDELMEVLHPQLGHETLLSWKIPEAICRVALDHHNPNPARDDHLLLCVQIGDAMSKKVGTHPQPEPELNLLKLRAVERLGLDDLELAAMMVDLEDEFDTLRQML